MTHLTRPLASPKLVGSHPVATRDRDETGAASAEYAAMTAAGVGLASVLIKLLTSDFGQKLLEMLIEFFLAMIGIG